jgi:hypothetical protein
MANLLNSNNGLVGVSPHQQQQQQFIWTISPLAPGGIIFKKMAATEQNFRIATALRVDIQTKKSRPLAVGRVSRVQKGESNPVTTKFIFAPRNQEYAQRLWDTPQNMQHYRYVILHSQATSKVEDGPDPYQKDKVPGSDLSLCDDFSYMIKEICRSDDIVNVELTMIDGSVVAIGRAVPEMGVSYKHLANKFADAVVSAT